MTKKLLYYNFLLIGLFSVVLLSCGDDEEFNPSFTLKIDGEDVRVDSFSADDFFADLDFTSTYNVNFYAETELGDLEMSVQQIGAFQELSNCLLSWPFEYNPELSSGFCLEDNGITACSESSATFMYEGEVESYSSFLQIGSVTIRGCNEDTRRIRGVFEGTLSVIGQTDNIQIEGRFEDLLIEG